VFQRGITYREFLEWRARTTTLPDATALIQGVPRMVRTREGTAALVGAMMSGDAFSLLGAHAMLGRTTGPADESKPDVVVLGFETWQRQFNADPGIVGSVVEFRERSAAADPPLQLLTVVGVLPSDFELPTGRPAFYLPLAPDPSRPSPRVTMIGHLKPGVPLSAAVDEANLIGAAVAAPRPANAPALPGPRFDVLNVKDQIVRQMRPVLRVLLAAAGLVLLIVSCSAEG